MGLYGHAAFIVEHGAGATGTVVVTMEECTASDGTGATAIPFKYKVADAADPLGAATLQDATATGFTIAAGADQQAVIEVDAADLSDGSKWLRMQLTEGVDSPVAAGVVAILSKPHYAGANLASAL
ncbi:MAG: hypothetical protein GY715_14235 [Planctomycetes bacterium]|nr:hypothetical protein [Planctomycetota bacterium]